MRLGLAQISSTDDKQQNLGIIAEMAKEGAAEGADLVVFPEYSMFETVPLSRPFVEAAEPLDGHFCSTLQQIARDAGVMLVAGVLEAVEGEDRASNTLVTIDTDGSLVSVYRKLHLYDAFGDRESDIIRPGEHVGLSVFDVEGVRVGLMTCYDLRFPEIARVLADEGVELAVLPSSWTPGPRKEDHWAVLTRARAIENTFFMASLSQSPPISTGGTLLVDPMGVIVGEIGEAPGMLIRDIDANRVAEVRQKVPSLSNRRFAVTPK